MRFLWLKKPLFAAVMLLTSLVNAHNPDEVAYFFSVQRSEPELIIHFTPKAAVDLIRFLNPELKTKPVIKLEDYLDDFESYFNKTVQLYLENRDVTFQLVDSNLYEHDATLYFKLNAEVASGADFDITITSYLDIYKHIKNFVSVKTPTKTYKCVLNATDVHCSTSSIQSENQSRSCL